MFKLQQVMLLIGVSMPLFLPNNVSAQERKIDEQEKAHLADAALVQLSLAESIDKIKGTSVQLTFAPKSFENAVSDSSKDVIAAFTGGDKQLIHERWAFDGIRSSYEALSYSASDEVTDHMRASFDGESGGLYLLPGNGSPGAGQLIDAAKVPGPVVAAKWSGNLRSPQGYSAQLKLGHPLEVDAPVVNGFKTVKIQSQRPTENGTERHTVWLAPDRSYREVRKDIVVSLDGPEYTARCIHYETLQFVQFGNQWIPKIGVRLEWLLDKQARRHWRRLDWFEVLETQPMTPKRSDSFSLDFPLGVQIADNATGRLYRVGGDVRSYVALLREATLPPDIEEFVRRTVNDVSTAQQK